MRIAFLIGNGFDIGMGLKSKFSNFFPLYVDRSQYRPIRLLGLAENIDKDTKNWSNFEKQMGRYTTEFTPESKQDYIDQLDDFAKEFTTYLSEQGTSLYFDKDKISAHMIHALTQFYVYPNLHTASAKRILDIFKLYRADNYYLDFINFNYTSVLDHCLECIPNKLVGQHDYDSKKHNIKIGDIVHVHGTSQDSPLMGVNDVSQIANKELAEDKRFSKYIVKPKLNYYLRMNYDLKATEIIKNSMITCVYGMSLGETDKNGGKQL